MYAHQKFQNYEKKALQQIKASELCEKHPVVYVIHELARGYKGINNYLDFQRYHGCYTTRAKADEMFMNFQNILLTHHDVSFKVRAEASENLTDEQMLTNGPKSLLSSITIIKIKSREYYFISK